MAENLELVRQAVDVIKNETEDGANTAARVGAAMRSILEYSEEQIEKQRTSSTALSQLVVGINNRTTELEEDRNLMQKAISANSDEVENLNEVVGDWDATGNDSVAEEIGSHYAEEGNSNYDSGLWGQLRNTRSRVSKLEAGVGSNASSEEDDGSVWGQLKWHGSEINGLHSTVANTIKSGGKINLATISSLSLAAVMSALGDNEIKMYLITDSSGNLPSLDGETAITITDTAKKLLFGRTDNFAVSVGDILAVTKLTCKVIPLNEAKAANGDFPGADGLESVWDKGQINKIAGIQTTANNALPKVDRLPSRWGGNMNNALDTGVYPWCTLGRPAGSTGAYTCIVNRTSTNDGSYDTIEQTAYGRQGELGRIFKRIIFYKSDGTDTQYGEWLEITGGSGDGVLTVSSVDELPADAENGSLAVVYDTPYYTKLTEEQTIIGWDATVDDLPTEISSDDFSSISTYNSICSMNGTVGGFGFEWQGSGIIYYSGYVAGKTYQGELYADVLKNANAADVIDGISSLLEKDKSIELVITPSLEDVVYKLFPKLRYREGDIIFNIYIKTLPYGWLSPILIAKEEVREECDTKLKEVSAEITAVDSKVTTLEEEEDLRYCKRYINKENSWLASLVSYNEETGYWEYLDYTDITTDEMIRMIGVRETKCFKIPETSKIRANLPIYNRTSGSAEPVNDYADSWPTTLKDLVYTRVAMVETYEDATNLLTNLTYYVQQFEKFTLYGCKAERVRFVIRKGTNLGSINARLATNLKYLWIGEISNNVIISDAPKIHYDSLRFLVEQAINTSAIQVTVHADTYSYLTGTAEPTEEVGGTTEEWQALVTTATEKNITFATA